MSDLIINHNREKLLNSIIFFAENTKYCGETKLFKLLYFLDFSHYLETGRSVTGLDYYAWKMGPVPVSLREEIDCPETDMADSISFKFVKTRFDNPMRQATAKTAFDPSNFSKRELKILNDLAKKYFESKSDQMIEETHFENLPWHQVYNVNKKKRSKIPYDLALKKSEVSLMKHMISEYEEIHNNYK